MTDESLEEQLQRISLMGNSNNAQTTSVVAFTPAQMQQISNVVIATINRLNNPAEETETNAQVDFSNIAQHEKVPDLVKCLREFSGKPGEFNSWRKSVDRILEMYDSVKNTAKYYNILHMIRHKVVGEADTALESYRTPLDWKKIKKCLMMHYSDKRDISTLEYQMTTLTQNRDTVTAFYQKVYQHLSLVLDKIDCLELTEESLAAMTNAYREKALDTFIRGLNGDLPTLLSIREPTTLPQALHMVLKLDNMNYRLNHAQLNQNYRAQNYYQPPPRPQKPHFRQQSRNFNTQKYNQQFYPELTYWPGQQRQISQQQQQQQPQNQFIRNESPFSNRNIPARSGQHSRPNLPPKPQARPEPMDVDHSIHSRQVNYQNRPNPYNSQRQYQNQSYKRPASQQNLNPNKIQRNYHTHANIDEDPDSLYTEKAACSNKDLPTDDINFLRVSSSSLPYIEHVMKSGKIL